MKAGHLAHLHRGAFPGGGQCIGGGGNSGETQNNGDCLDHFACVPFYHFPDFISGAEILHFFDDTSSAIFQKMYFFRIFFENNSLYGLVCGARALSRAQARRE